DFVINFFQANRFQLELMVLRLKDIMEDIPKKEDKGEAVKEFYENTRILDVLEAMGNTPHKQSILGIKSNDHKNILQTTSEAIMLAFYKKRAKLLQ
ncbi:MAG: ABC transporter ATP-binding protein, partial [Candidatus Hodarchaeota archaeon]